jgi:hypothetical protein
MKLNEIQQVIDQDQMMGVLLNACPSFAPHWQTFLDEWASHSDELPLYLVLGDFARHVIGFLERHEIDWITNVFTAVECLQNEGDQYVREAMTIGFLENVQNSNLHPNGTDPEQFRQYLGPVTVKFWDKLNRFWQNGEVITEV